MQGEGSNAHYTNVPMSDEYTSTYAPILDKWNWPTNVLFCEAMDSRHALEKEGGEWYFAANEARIFHYPISPGETERNWSGMGRRVSIGKLIGAFIHKKDRDFHRDLKYWDIFALVQTSGNISLIAERDDSGHRTAHAWYQALPLFWYARLEWWDRKYQDYLLERSHICHDANNCAYSQIITLIPK